MRTWNIDGQAREALVSVATEPTRADAPRALVFVFHGHGGTMRQAARTMPVHAYWPEAIVVYPQGLPTPGRITDPAGERSGWQRVRGDQGDRDLHFVDAMLDELGAAQGIDARRTFAMGHSNGGAFVYLLWAERGGSFAAFAPSAAVFAPGVPSLTPHPVLHVASPQDPLVRFAWQARMIDAVLRINHCGRRQSDRLGYTAYAPRTNEGAEVATFFHDQGHRYPVAATPKIVAFFQAHGANSK